VGWTGPGISQITPIALPTSLVVADALNGAQLVDRSLANANLPAGVSTTYADTSADGRYVVFGTSSASSFGNGGTAFGDTNTNPAAPYSDLLVLDRQSGSMRLATSGSAATTTRSRQSQFVGLTADSQYLIYTTDYAEAIGDFSTPGKSQPSTWVLVEGGYPTASGKSKTTSLRVADIDPAKLSIALAGGSIDNDGVLASVSSPTISRSAGTLSFWVQASDDVYTKAVKLVLEDTATGMVVKATQAKYTEGAQPNYNWTTSGNSGSVATSLNGGGYGVSLLEVQGANLTDLMRSEGAVASRDLIAFNLLTGEQRLLSHSAAIGNKQSQAPNLANATLSAGGRYVLFTANDATKLGNYGTAFSDSATGFADLFAADLETNQIRLLSHTAASATASAGVNVSLLGTSEDDRFAIFSSSDASAFGFSDSATNAIDLFAVSLNDGTIELISRAGSGTPSTTSGQAVGFEKIVGNHVYFTANDATKLGFSSDGDTSKADLFRYNLSTGAVDLISRTTSSATASLNGTYQSGSLTVSPDGRYVAFVVDLPSSFGGFTVGIAGGALLMLDTQTGALRMLNSSNNGGSNLSYGAWSGIANQASNPRFFTADSKTFTWQTTYTNFIAITNKSFAAGVNQQYGSVALALDLSNGLATAGETQLSRVLSHTAKGVDEIAPSVTLLGVSADSRLAFFSAGDASPFGNDGVAFTDSNTSATDIIAVDLTSRRLELVSGASDASFGQAATYRGLGEGGTVLFSLANVNGISTEAGLLTDSNGTGTDILSRRFNLIDLVSADDSLNADGSGSRSDNITNRNSYTLEAWAKPGMAVQLLDGDTVVASKTAAADGRLSWQLTDVADGVHVYSLQYSDEGIPIRLSSPLGSSSLTVTVQTTPPSRPPTGTITISGTPTQGQTLTVINTLADGDGIPNSGAGAIAYQWKADGSAIAGATGSSLLLTQALVGKAISVTVSYIDNGGTAESRTSSPTTLVVGANAAPTDLALSSTSVAENAAVGTTVGSLTTTDPDAGDTFTYSLVSGTGSTDNDSFTITGSTIKTATVLDVQTKDSYNIRVRSTDAAGLFTEKALTIRVIDQVASESDIPISLDSDGDGVANVIDPDDDNDGVLDNNDGQPLNSASSVVATRSVSVVTSADASLRGNSSSNASSNFGSSAIAETRNGQRGLLMKFSLPDDGILQSATLKLYTNTENDPLDVYLFPDNLWTESGVTYNNAPFANSVFLGETGSPSGSLYSFTLPQNSALTAGAIVSLYVEDPDDPSSNVEQLYTKETAGKAPSLLIAKSDPSPLNISVSDQEVYRISGSFSVNIALRSAPAGTVYVPLAVSAPSVASIGGASVLTFTAADWATPQSVTFTPNGVGDFTLVVRPLHSTDANFNGVNPDDVTGFKVSAIDLAAGTAVAATTGQILSQNLQATSAVGSTSFRWKLLSGPVGLNVVENSGRLTFRPASHQAGLTTMAVLQATDMFGNTANFEVPVSVSSGVNADPVGIYVVPSIGSDTTGNGTAANPYGSISYALDRAAATGNSTVFIRGGEYSLGSSSQAITTAAGSEIVVKPLPGEHAKLNFSGFTGFDITSAARNITFEGLEIDGGSDATNFWDVVSVGFWDPSLISRGGGIAFNVDGQFIALRDNYIHDAYQKAVEIKDGRYVDVDGNIIRNIATTSLSGGHGIMRQQKGAEFFDNDIAGELRWDITGNMIFNVEQRIYSWVPSKGFIDMVLDEGKPILIDDPKDTNNSQEGMAARISHNIVAYGAIDGIRLKSTPNLEVSNNSVFSQGLLADGVTDRDGDTSTPKFTNFQFTNNAVKVGVSRFAVEIDDAVADAGVGALVSGNVVGGGQLKPTGQSGITNLGNVELFTDAINGNFSINPALNLSGVGVAPAILTELNQRSEAFGVQIGWDRWEVDHLKLT